MPQVQVALRALAAGRSVRVNDVISYITTAPTEKSSDSAAKRAYSPLDVQKSKGELKPDIDWYLAKQIFPPIERLCAPIEGTTAGQLAECLGLDPKKYALNVSRAESGPQEITPLESQLPDEVRYRDCPRLQLTCLKCKHTFPFEGITKSPDAVSPKGVKCPAVGCGKLFPTLTLVAQTEHAIRVMASEYYEGWLVCDDPACQAQKTRSMSVYGHRCLGPNGLAHGCLGRMTWEKGGRSVGSTLSYWNGIWDVDKAIALAAKGVKVEDKEQVDAVAERNRERFETVKGVVEGYVKQCGWVWVQMDSLFGFALR
jgi:DNA polymerase alpha subunit A